MTPRAAGRGDARDLQDAPLRARPLAADERQAYAAARLHAVHGLMPYLATAVFRLEPWAVDGLGTFGVDASWRVLVDPVVLDEWGVPATAGVLLHEVGHALRDHAGQAELLGSDVDRFAWNCCGDAAINDDLVAAGVPLPGAPILPSDLRDADGAPMATGGTAMAYYDALPRVAVADDADGDLLAVRPPGTEAGTVVRIDGRRGSHENSCGTVAGGARHDVSLPTDARGATPAEQRLARRAVATAVEQAARSRPGTVPAGLRRWAGDELAPPQVPWRQLLRGAVRRGFASAAGAVDTTYARPSRRRVPGVVLPGTRRPVPAVAVVVDTSASMGQGELTAVLSEVEDLARQVGATGQRLRVLTVDAAVHEVRSVARAADVVLRGGGGTDLTPGLHAAVEGRPRPDVVVVCTDGFTPWPDEPPARARWVVVLVRGADGPARDSEPAEPPSWAYVVSVEVAA